MSLQGKVAIVFGASAGIGRAYVLALAEQGANVVAAARTLGAADGSERNTLNNVVKLAEGLPGKVVASTCDVESEADITRTIEQAVAKFGGLDIVVNNSVLMPLHPPMEVPEDVWDKMMRINVRGPYFAIRQAAPHMEKRGGGSIINITAKAGEASNWGHMVGYGIMAYAVTKAALNRLTIYMAEELRAANIAVNALSPGVVATDTALAATPNLVELGGKAPTAEVLGPALVYLAGQDAGSMTGQVLYTDLFGKTWPEGAAEAQA